MRITVQLVNSPTGQDHLVLRDDQLQSLTQDHPPHVTYPRSPVEGQRTSATRGVLGAFANQVEALVRTGRLPDADGQALISAARCVTAAPAA